MKIVDIILICVFLTIILFILFYKHSEPFVPVKALTEYKHCKQNIEFFKKVIDFLEKYEIEYWATCGTLLGTMRDKGMIPWDDDNDICIQRSEIEKITLKMDILKDLGIGWSSVFFGYKFYDLNGKPSDGNDYNYPFVDVFVMSNLNKHYFYESSKAIKIWPNEYYIKDELFPLKKLKYEYYEIFCPNNPTAFLDRAYKEWKIKAVKTYDHLIDKTISRIEFPIEYDRFKKPYLWTYWDNVNRLVTPPLIDLCYKTVQIHCTNSFDVVRLSSNNIKKYLPELSEYEKEIAKLQIAHKVDLYRIMLLYKYGGLYIDADTIVLRDPIEIMEKLEKYDYVGFGCSGDKCKNGYMKPSNGILASRPNTWLFGNILMNILNKIKTKDKFDYFSLGKYIIWEELKKVEDYEYYQYDNNYDGTRDSEGNWVTSRWIFSNVPIKYDNENSMIFFTLYNSELNDNVKKLSASDILSAGWNVSKFLKKGLKIEN